MILSPPQALGHNGSAFRSTGPTFGAPSGTRPSLALDSLAAEVALEVALDQKRKQLHGMLGSPVGGDGGAPAARRGVEIFTKGPAGAKGDGHNEEGTWGIGKGDNEERGNFQESDAGSRGRVGQTDAVDATGLPVDNGPSVLAPRQEELDGNVADVSQSRSELASTSAARPPSETGNRSASERVVDPDSIERRLSRIGEMLDISSLPISSRAAAHRQSQRPSRTNSTWDQTGLHTSLSSGLGGVERGESVLTEANTPAPAKAVVHRASEEFGRSRVATATTVVFENVAEGAPRDVDKTGPVAGSRISTRSSGDEEFFSIPPTPSQSGPPVAAVRRTSVEGRAVTALELDQVATSTTLNQTVDGQDLLERANPISNVLKQAQKQTEAAAELAEPGRELEANRGDVEGLVSTEGVGSRKPAAPRAEGLRTVADGASLWAPNPRPRRKSDSVLVLPQTLWTTNPTGPPIRGTFSQAQPAAEGKTSPAQINAEEEPGRETGGGRERPGLITELEGEELDYSGEGPGGHTGSASAKKAASRSKKQSVQVHSPPYRRSVKSPGGSNRRSRARPIQLMSALKHLTSNRGKAPGTTGLLSAAFSEEPVTPEFATDGGIVRPKQATIRNLQKTFDSVAGPVRRGSLDDMVSIELGGEAEDDTPGVVSRKSGESQLGITGDEAANGSPPGSASTGVLIESTEQGESGRGSFSGQSKEPSGLPSASPVKPSRDSIDPRSGGSGSAVGLSGEGKEMRDAGRQLAEEREARRAAKSRAQAAEENAKVGSLRCNTFKKCAVCWKSVFDPLLIDSAC